MTAVEFCKTTLSIPNPNLRAIDRSPDEFLLQALFEGTGVPVERILEASLLPEDGYVFSQSGKGEKSWVIPSLGITSHINKYTAGMPYCPACLHSDETPYYRKQWQFAFNPLCPIHRIPLRSTCPHCKQPYTHMQPIARKIADVAHPIGACWSCGGDVGSTESDQIWGSGILDQALSVQSNMWDSINQGVFAVHGYGHVHTRAYLDVMLSILKSLTAGKHASKYLDYACLRAGGNFKSHLAPPSSYKDFELRPAEDRAVLLCLTKWLMDEWPSRLVAYVEDNVELSQSYLFAKIDTPYWLSTTALPLLQPKTIGFRSKEEIENATILLRSKLKRPVTPSEVKEFMSNGFLGDHTAEKIAWKKACWKWHHSFMEEWRKEQEAAKRKKLAKIIQWSQSKKFMSKLKKLDKDCHPDEDTGNTGIQTPNSQK